MGLADTNYCVWNRQQGHIILQYYIWYPIINYNGKEYGKEYVYNCIAQSLCYTPETKTTL